MAFPLEASGRCPANAVHLGGEHHIEAGRIRAYQWTQTGYDVTNYCNNGIAVFPISETGSQAHSCTYSRSKYKPVRSLGNSSRFELDLRLANEGNTSVAVFPKSLGGDVPPALRHPGKQTQPSVIFMESLGDLNWIYVGRPGCAGIAAFPIGASGNVAPATVLSKGNSLDNAAASRWGWQLSPPSFLDSAIHVSKGISCGGYNPCFQNIQSGVESQHTRRDGQVNITEDNYIENIILGSVKLIFLRARTGYQFYIEFESLYRH